MGKIQKTHTERVYNAPPEYTNEELKAFEKELEPYKIDIPHYKGNNGKPYFGVNGHHNFLKDMGALSEKSTSNSWVVRDIPLFQEIGDKLEQFGKLLKRREYAIKQERLETEKLAEQITIKNAVSPDSFID